MLFNLNSLLQIPKTLWNFIVERCNKPVIWTKYKLIYVIYFDSLFQGQDTADKMDDELFTLNTSSSKQIPDGPLADNSSKPSIKLTDSSDVPIIPKMSDITATENSHNMNSVDR